jgi:hypothetical protein
VKRCRIEVTITKVFEAEFEDTSAAARMFKTLEADRQLAVLAGASGEGWKVRQASEQHSVQPLHEDSE